MISSTKSACVICCGGNLWHLDPIRENKVNPTLLICHHARLDGILDHLKEAIGELGSSYSQAQWDNLTRAERRAITELKDNPELVINKADKGSLHRSQQH